MSGFESTWNQKRHPGKAVKNKPLTQRQPQRNRLITKARYVVERTFDSQARWFGSKVLRYRAGQCTYLTYSAGYGL